MKQRQLHYLEYSTNQILLSIMCDTFTVVGEGHCKLGLKVLCYETPLCKCGPF